jgi:putative ABC transport system permease protein
VGLILSLAPDDMALPATIPLNWTVLMFAITLGTGTGVVFGLIPAILTRRMDPARDLRGARQHESVAGRRTQRVVLATQLGLSLVLLVTGGLLARSAAALSRIEPGFTTEDVWTARLALTTASYSLEEATQLYHDIVDRLATEPGIETATLIPAMPFSGRGGSSSFEIVGRESPDNEQGPEALRRTVLPNYHETLGIPLREGRYLQATDRTFQAPVAVISESLARRFWPNGGAVGSRIERDRREFEIVGIVGDVLHSDLSMPAQPTFYVPFDVAESRHRMTVVVRSGLGDDTGGVLRRGVWAIDEDVPVEGVASATMMVARSTQDERFRSLIIAIFAAAATLLCATGLFAVTSRIVTARRRELGIRLALGARKGQLVRRVALEEAGALVAGLMLRVIGTYLAGGLLESFMFGVTTRDPAAIGTAVLILGATGTAATLLTVRRGARLDPAETMRVE